MNYTINIDDDEIMDYARRRMDACDIYTSGDVVACFGSEDLLHTIDDKDIIAYAKEHLGLMDETQAKDWYENS